MVAMLGRQGRPLRLAMEAGTSDKELLEAMILITECRDRFLSLWVFVVIIVCCIVFMIISQGDHKHYANICSKPGNINTATQNISNVAFLVNK